MAVDNLNPRLVTRYGWLTASLLAIALASRIGAALVLPNAEQDGYSYAEIIGRLTEQFRSGHFQPADLFGFWLPLFQAVSALGNLWIHDPMVAGKIVNVLCGTISLLVVFDLTHELTGNLFLSVFAFVLLLLDPLHILYCAGCMTDVPHGTAVLASLWCAVRRRWLTAAVFAALAECIRVESWALILALPLLQWVWDRRLSLLVVIILLAPPLLWIGLAYRTTGDPLAYFADRAHYHGEYIQFHPARAGFDWNIIGRDVDYFFLGAGRVISAGAIAATVIFSVRQIRLAEPFHWGLLAPLFYGGAMLALIALAYLTKAQPVLLPRYGLTFLAIGLPLFAWALQWCLGRGRLPVARSLIAVGVLVGCTADIYKQLPTIWKVRQDYRAHQRLAAALAMDLATLPTATRCFSDDAAIRVLSRLPADHFLRSPFAPDWAKESSEAFLQYLRSQNVGYIVYFPTEASLPVKFFPELGRSDRVNNSTFELISYESSIFGPDVWLYRMR